MSPAKACSPELRSTVEKLIGMHRTAWLRFVQRLLGNEADAEDAVQEAVRRVLERDRRFRSKEEARMYLGRAISNTAIEFYHARRRDCARTLPLRESSCSDLQSLSPHDRLEENEEFDERERLLRVLIEGLTRLPVKQYEALRITVLEPGAVSIRDAGMANGIPYSTLRHRSVQGLRRLRKYATKALRGNRSNAEGY
jgi:RNA polymerase sigma factor (sigma-70 family)